MKSVLIITLNWNNLQDSVLCIKSLLSINYRNYKILFIDNASSDGSFEGILGFLESQNISFYMLEENYDREYIKNTNIRLLIKRNKSNLGYTGGFNTGLRFVLEAGGFDYVWILNNDTVVEKDSLDKLVRCFEEHKSRGINVGAAGTMLVYPDGSVQTVCGSRLSKIISNSSFLKEKVEDVGYIIGASLFLDMEALKNVGLFDERFFLYWDDADYGVRLKKAGYKLICCDDVVVYHKEGGTAGKINKLNDYYWVRNGLLFTWKHYPYFLPVVLLAYVFKYTILRTIKRQPNNLSSLFLGIYHFFKGKFGKKP